MKKTCVLAIATACVGSLAVHTHAELVTGTVTADNHYALYSSTGNAFMYHGGNELTATGNPGLYNWSEAENWAFEAGEYLYIVAWSDHRVAQGVLAAFQSAGMGTILSGDARWQVYGTQAPIASGDPHPLAVDIAGHVSVANASNLWETPFVGGPNTVAPWGAIAGIDAAARWMWIDVPGDDDPLNGDSGAREMLIFRTMVPSPGAFALLALSGVVARRRRR